MVIRYEDWLCTISSQKRSDFSLDLSNTNSAFLFLSIIIIMEIYNVHHFTPACEYEVQQVSCHVVVQLVIQKY